MSGKCKVGPYVLVLGLAWPFGVQASDGDAGPDQYICATQTAISASALTTGETGSWSVVSGAATFTPANSPGSFVSGLAIGENILQWTVLLNGSPSSTDQVTITVYDPSAAPAHAGPDITVCVDQPTAVMQAAPVGFPVLGNWTVISGVATITSPTTAQTTVICSGLGQVVLQWTVFNGPCGETSDQVTISVEDCQTGMLDHVDQLAIVCVDEQTRVVNMTHAKAGAQAVLLDASGRRTMAATVDASGVLRFSVAALPVGWYVVHVVGRDGPQLLRFLLSH